jgi:hypothetical protein
MLTGVDLTSRTILGRLHLGKRSIDVKATTLGGEIIKYFGLKYNTKKGINKNSIKVYIAVEMSGTYLRGKQITCKFVNP